MNGGDKGSRTPDLLNAIETLYQLSYIPIYKPATSYSRTGESRTTLGDGELDFCVRNGNRYDFSSMVTGKKPFSWELKRTATFEMRVVNDLTFK